MNENPDDRPPTPKSADRAARPSVSRRRLLGAVGAGAAVAGAALGAGGAVLGHP